MDDKTRKKLDELAERLDTASIMSTAFVRLLPDSPIEGLAILSACIDKYADEKDLDKEEVWDMLYVTAKEVREAFG
ncbi:MAG: hypothetical protein J6S49_06545 [Erysipelotrichaceae bacterium]|nr:hypothetical protein [Erysipelotrichaceae bacterium]